MKELIKTLAACRRGSRNETDGVWDLISPESAALARLKRVSIRKGSWFAVLNWKQRKFIDAVVMTVDKIRSLLLLRVLAPLIRKLLTAIDGDERKAALALMGKGAQTIMKDVAMKIVMIAQKWGNKSAHVWVNDGFIKHLMVMNLPQNKNPHTSTINLEQP